MSERVDLTSILAKIGFKTIDGMFYYDMDNCILQVVPGINQYFAEGFTFLGLCKTERTLEKLDFFIPSEVESYEQGLAFIAYFLRKADLNIKPDWLLEGLALKDELPWNREQKAFREKPEISIDHEWFRVLARKLRSLSAIADDNDITSFNSDGEVLKIVCNKEKFASAVSGKNWPGEVCIKTKKLEFLPKRIPHREVCIYIWNNKLHISNRVFDLAD